MHFLFCKYSSFYSLLYMKFLFIKAILSISHDVLACIEVANQRQAPQGTKQANSADPNSTLTTRHLVVICTASIKPQVILQKYSMPINCQYSSTINLRGLLDTNLLSPKNVKPFSQCVFILSYILFLIAISFSVSRNLLT